MVDSPVALLPAQQDLLLKTLNQLGRLWEVSLRYAEAETALRRSLEIDPQQPDVLQHWQHLRQRQCIWPVALPFGEVSAYSLLMSHSTLSMLAAHDDPALQLLAARSYVARKLPPAPAALSAGRRYHHSRLRVGYLSGDLCTHAVGLLLADLFEQHDRRDAADRELRGPVEECPAIDFAVDVVVVDIEEFLVEVLRGQSFLGNHGSWGLEGGDAGDLGPR